MTDGPGKKACGEGQLKEPHYFSSKRFIFKAYLSNKVALLAYCWSFFDYTIYIYIKYTYTLKNVKNIQRKNDIKLNTTNVGHPLWLIFNYGQW